MKKIVCLTLAASIMAAAVSCGDVDTVHESAQTDITTDEPEKNTDIVTGETTEELSGETTGAPAEENSTAADTAVPAAESSVDPMPAYRAALEQIYYSCEVPFWENIEDDHFEVSDNDFAIYDIDLDGRDELLFFRDAAAMSGMYAIVYDVDENGELRVELESSPFMHFFSNGKIKVDISHNQGLAGGFWPYSLLGYDAQNDSYYHIAYVDAWDGNLFPESYDGEPFPSDVDTSGSGFVYYIFDPYYAYDRENKPEPIDKSEFDEWYDEQLGGAEEVFPEFVKLTEENIALLTSSDVGAGDIYPELYKLEVARVFDRTGAQNDGAASVSYALCDLDGNGIPELLLKHGTCEADFVISVYTVGDDGKLNDIAELGGSHASFGYSEDGGSLVLIYGHMGNGALRWFSLTDGVLSETKNVSFELTENDSYDDYMDKYGVKRVMECVSAFNIGYGDSETKSYLYHTDGSEEQFSGLYLDYIK